MDPDPELLSTALLLLLGIALLCWRIRATGLEKLPPRVPTAPLFGSLPFMRKGLHSAFREWHNKYGQIITVQMGSYRAVVIGQLDILKEAFRDNAIMGRPDFPQFKYITNGKKRGVTFNEGPHQLEQREFFVRSLKDCGFGKKSMEDMIHEDIEDFLARLPLNSAISPKHIFGLPILRSLWYIATSERYSLDDEELQLIARSFTTAISTATGPSFLMPWFNYLFPSVTKFKVFTNAIDLINGHIQSKIDERISQKGTIENADFLDAYLKQITAKKDDINSSFHGDVGLENLKASLFNVFGGGLETTSATLSLALTLLAANPDVQEEFAEELSREVGPGRLPTLEDKKRMPLAVGIVSEVLRLSMSFGNPRKCTQDTTLRGYKIPKNTVVFANMYYIHHDPAVWRDPENFRPSRYLEKPELYTQIVTFSSGRRSCPGELLARNNIFLFLSAICTRFSFKFDPGSEIPNITNRGTNAVSLHYFKEDFKLIFTPRERE